MKRRQPRSCAWPFVLITAGLLLFTACYVVDGRRDTSCRSAGRGVELVAAVAGKGPGGKTDTRKRDQAPSARPPVRDQVRKDPAPRPRRDRAHAPSGATATPTPSPSGSCT